MSSSQVLAGALILSVIHGVMPDHWIPLVAVSKTEKWSRRESLLATTLVGIPHTISTVGIGIIVGLIGYKISSSYEMVGRIVAPSILGILGLIYIFLDFKRQRQHNFIKIGEFSRKSKFAVIAPLATALFLSPCVAIGAYYFVAGGFGWFGIAMVSATYLIVTVGTMILMVNLGLKGIERIRWHFLEQHERLVTGIVLVILGIFIYFVGV